MKFRLDEICVMQSGGTPTRGEPLFYDGNIAWAKITDFDKAVDDILTETEESISEYGLRSINNRLFEKNTLLLAMYGSIGKVVLTGKEMSCNQAILAIRPINPDILDIRYLKYWFEYHEGYLNSLGQGAILQNVSLSIIKRLEIDLPDLITQNKIISILDKGMILQRKRDQSIFLYNQLLVSTFIALFGNPILNNLNWEVKLLKDVARLERGRFSARPRNDPAFFGGNFPFIQTGDINNSDHRLNRYTQTLNETGIKVSKKFEVGDIVIAIVGATIGATAILGIDTYATDSIIGIKPIMGMNNVFLEAQLRFYRKVLLDNAPEAARANINLGILNKIKIIVPPKESQLKFETISKKIDDEILKLSESKKRIVTNYKTLLQNAFTGKLNFNIDFELDSLVKEIKLEQKNNDLSKIIGNSKLFIRFIERLNSREFVSKDLYDKAKHGLFQLLTSNDSVRQEFTNNEMIRLFIK